MLAAKERQAHLGTRSDTGHFSMADSIPNQISNPIPDHFARPWLGFTSEIRLFPRSPRRDSGVAPSEFPIGDPAAYGDEIEVVGVTHRSLFPSKYK